MVLNLCRHENTQWEYVECKNYVEVYKCLGCNQEVERYIECQ